MAVMPPMVASAPGSTLKNSPVSRRCSFSCFRVTPASTRQSMSSAFTCSLSGVVSAKNALGCAGDIGKAHAAGQA